MSQFIISTIHPYNISLGLLRLVRTLAIYAQCGLNLFFFRKNNDVYWRKENIS